VGIKTTLITSTSFWTLFFLDPSAFWNFYEISTQLSQCVCYAMCMDMMQRGATIHCSVNRGLAPSATKSSMVVVEVVGGAEGGSVVEALAEVVVEEVVVEVVVDVVVEVVAAAASVSVSLVMFSSSIR